MTLQTDDPEIASLVDEEERRLEASIDLIAAENHAARSIMEVTGSILNTKTIEGYPGRRFHAGCVHVDRVEAIAVSRAQKLFAAEHANVQPHSGTSANLAVYFSVLDVGDRILSMHLPHGGHLSHGHRASITSRCFCFDHYGVDPVTEQIDYEALRNKARAFKPKMIVAGASAYPRLIDYERMAQIAREVSAFLLADMAHIAGLVAAGVIPSPVPHCDFVTFTGYKTMMGGRGGVILCRKPHAGKIDRAVFPGCQGTSAVNMIAAKAVIFKLAMQERFVQIQKQTLENAVKLAHELASKGYRIVTGGTQNHQVLADVTAKGLDGKAAEEVLESVGLIANRNVIPGDADKIGAVSGIRLGTSAAAARGMGIEEMAAIAAWIDQALDHRSDRRILERIRQGVEALCQRFPLYRQN